MPFKCYTVVILDFKNEDKDGRPKVTYADFDTTELKWAEIFAKAWNQRERMHPTDCLAVVRHIQDRVQPVARKQKRKAAA